jgi:uncharacterized NAD(P)/FAD-binding protein YdhS
MVTAQLLRRHYSRPCRVVLINRSGPMARGVAYGTRSSHHVLNVPAGRMSAFPEDGDHFLRFARTQDPGANGGTFVARRIYGDYLAHTLAESAAAAGTALLQRIADEVVDIELADRGGTLRLKGGRTIHADGIVLALGNYAPGDLPLADRSFFASSLYVRDPWAPGALADVPVDRPVLLIGTGLTALDVSLELAARRRRAPITIVSRRGLIPMAHRGHGSPPSYTHMPPGLVACEPMAVEYLKAIREHIAILAKSGVDWREVVASLRPLTSRLWHSLDTREKARFLRHLRPFWDVHRHRVAPETYRSFEALREGGTIIVRAGRVLAIEEEDEEAWVTIRPRGSVDAEETPFACVVNCTGPEGDIRALDDTLIRQLLARGLARPDPLGIGLEVRPDLSLIEESGRASALLSLVGPLLKGALWEATAVPELRVHAANVAGRLHDRLEAAWAREDAKTPVHR